MIEVDGCAVTLRLLFRKILRPLYHGNLTTHGGDMHIFIERLRGTETARITGAYIDIFRRVEPYVSTRTEYHMIDHIMFIQAAADQEAPPGILPFILQESTFDMYLLVGETVVTNHFIFQMVEVIFQSGGQVRRHEEELIEAVGILGAGHPGHVGCLAIGVRVFPCAVIAVAVGILGGGEYAEAVLVVG